MLPEDEKTLAVAKRTLKNLEYIYEAKHKAQDVEEFTQLLNSMLGMIICLREEYFKGREVSWKEIEKHGLNKSYIEAKVPHVGSPGLKPHDNFSQLITRVRHGFSHNCFTLTSNSEKVITGITIWNIPTGKKNEMINRCWEATITESQLKSLATLFVSFISIDLQGALG